jgi:hypothetical protein
MQENVTELGRYSSGMSTPDLGQRSSFSKSLLPTLVQDQELYNSCNMPPQPNTGVKVHINSCSMTEIPCSNRDSKSVPTCTSEIPKKYIPNEHLRPDGVMY